MITNFPFEGLTGHISLAVVNAWCKKDEGTIVSVTTHVLSHYPEKAHRTVLISSSLDVLRDTGQRLAMSVPSLPFGRNSKHQKMTPDVCNVREHRHVREIVIFFQNFSDAHLQTFFCRTR